MEGSAAQWLSQVAITGITWSQAKDLFIAQFGGSETATSALIKIQNENRLKNESIGAFGVRLRSSLEARWGSLTVDEIISAIVIARLAPYDSQIERLAHTADIKTETAFLNEIRTFSYMQKRPESSMDNAAPSEPKRFKPSMVIRYHGCGKMGHKDSECRSSMKITRRPDAGALQEGRKPTMPGKMVICYKCREVGHVSSHCPQLKRSRSGEGAANKEGAASARRVDMCSITVSSGSLLHRGESFSFCFDSGAECSLIKESVSNKFSGNRFNQLVMLRGICNTSVNCIIQILSTIVIDDHTLEIPFHVINDDYLNHGGHFYKHLILI